MARNVYLSPGWLRRRIEHDTRYPSSIGEAHAMIDALLTQIRNAPCPHLERDEDKWSACYLYGKCDCWKRAALGESDD